MSYAASASCLTSPALPNYQISLADTISACHELFKGVCEKAPSLASEIRDGVGDTAVTRHVMLVESEPSLVSTQRNCSGVQKAVQKAMLQDTLDVRGQKTIIKNNHAQSEDTTLSNELLKQTRRHVPQLGMIDAGETIQMNDDEDLQHTQKDSREIEIGKVIACRYEILTEISRGGFGIVYRARQIGLDRVVALKRLHVQNDELAMRRFFLEANVIKDLVHPNTIQLIDAGMDNNHLYLVMEYIEGQSLRELIDTEHALSPMRALNITKQILKSIHEAHERGIIHRDLKPSNILIRKIIGEQDFVKVLDFGIAKVQYQDMPRLTQSGKILGTPQYLAPELLYGDEATPSTDIFSVALMLVEMLTGQVLLPKSPAAIVKISTNSDPLPIPEWILNSPLGPIIQRALCKDPSFRYRHASEMIADIQIIETEMLVQIQSSAIRTPPKINSRMTKLIALYGLILLLIIANIVLIGNLLI